MSDAALGLLLLGSVLLVFRARKLAPLGQQRPLDQEDNLPPLWAGHASTIFSLNALFGAYLIIWMTVGIWPVLGICLGGLIALLILAFDSSESLRRDEVLSFEEYITGKNFSSDLGTNNLLWVTLLLTQIAYAVGELLILSYVAEHTIRLTPRAALTLSLGIALIAYLYSAIGGWRGVFETDVYQLVFLGATCAVFLIASLVILIGGKHESFALSPPGEQDPWFAWLNLPRPLKHFLEILVGAAMGCAFLLASPDTWKRVFSTVRSHKGRKGSVWAIAMAGIVPFIVLFPVVAMLPPINIDNPQIDVLFNSLRSSPLLLVAFVVGLTAAFLSSFDSSLVSVAHLVLLKRSLKPGVYTLGDYHVSIGLSFLLVILVFLGASTRLDNPYMVGLALMGFYAVVGGVTLGTRFFNNPVRQSVLFWLFSVLLVAWMMYAMSRSNVWTAPNASHLVMVPVAASGFLAIAFLVAFLARKQK